MSKKHRAEEIIGRYRRNQCTAEEQAWVESWHLMELSKKDNDLSEEDLEGAYSAVFREVSRRESVLPTVSRNTSRWWWAAAVLIGSLFSVLYWYNPRSEMEKEAITANAVDIGPGGNKATLTVDDGTSIALDETENLVTVSGNAITYADGAVVEPSGKEQSMATLRYHTLTVPNGGEYQVVLDDGTKVWLNAASSLRFPQQFIGKDRVVELVGEAYFEVASDRSKPFKVKSRGQVLEVLGTHFNVNAYRDEQVVRTTLLEGAVRVSADYTMEHVLLKPGQQSLVNPGKSGIVVSQVDKDVALAWQKGYFLFDDTDLESIMKQVERWYDVEVVYASRPSNKTFLGMVSRSRNISAVLYALEQVGNVRFRIDGKKVTVFG